MSVQCHIGRKSRAACGPSAAHLQTLSELDAPTATKQVKKLSWMILSRIGVNFLVNPASFAGWTVCLNHRRELLDSWMVSKGCCYPGHRQEDDQAPLKDMVTMIMSIKLIQAEGKVVPISGRICAPCKASFDSKHGANATQKVVIVIPRGGGQPATSSLVSPGGTSVTTTTAPTTSAEASLAVPSPFVKQEPIEVEEEEEGGAVAPSSPPSSPPIDGPVNRVDVSASTSISLKTEVVEPPMSNVQDEMLRMEDEEEENIIVKEEPEAVPVSITRSTAPKRRNLRAPVVVVPDAEEVIEDEDAVEDDEEDPFSEDSDDDRTWAPAEKAKKQKAEKEARPLRPAKLPKPAKPPKEPKKKPGPKKPRGRPKRSFVENSSSHPDESIDQSILVDGGGNNYHYFCKVCQITFFKHSSYKLHMRVSTNLHAEIEERNSKPTEYSCGDCCIAFIDKRAQDKHMASVHGSSSNGGRRSLSPRRKNPARSSSLMDAASQQSPYYCSKCDVLLKSDSAFKSHNSKLHLERREKIYYCRECDETFKCKVKQQKHIKTHRLWSGEDPGMQCHICGKVFAKNQVHPYQRHMAIHELSESHEQCDCRACIRKRKLAPAGAEVDNEDEDYDATPAGPPSAKLPRLTHDPSEESVDDPGESQQQPEPIKTSPGDPGDSDEVTLLDDELPFHCALCKDQFAIPTELEDHVRMAHNKDNETARQPEDRKPKFTQVRVANKSQIEKVKDNSWQDSLERNWAADFGYGKPSSLGKNKVDDLFKKMQMKFKTLPSSDEPEHEEELRRDAEEAAREDEQESFEVYRVRGFKGNAKLGLQKAPRTLSAASLTTRKRMEKLLLRAKEQQQVREEKRKVKSERHREHKEKRRKAELNLRKQQQEILRNAVEMERMNKERKAREEREKLQATQMISGFNSMADDENYDDIPAHSIPLVPESTARPASKSLPDFRSNAWNRSSGSNVISIATQEKKEEENNQQLLTTTPESTAPATAIPVLPEIENASFDPRQPDETNLLLVPVVAVADPALEEEDEDLSFDDSDDDSEGEEEELELEPATPKQQREADEIILEVLSRDPESIMIPLNNGWVCEKVPLRREKGKFKNYFWSTEDEAVDPFRSVAAVHCYCRKRTLKFNRAVFEKAIDFDPNSPPPLPMVSKRKKKKSKKARKGEGEAAVFSTPSPEHLAPVLVIPAKDMSRTVDQIIAEEDVQVVKDKNNSRNNGANSNEEVVSNKNKVSAAAGLRVRPMMVRIHDRREAEILDELEEEIEAAAAEQAMQTAAEEAPNRKRTKRN